MAKNKRPKSRSSKAAQAARAEANGTRMAVFSMRAPVAAMKKARAKLGRSGQTLSSAFRQFLGV